MALEIWAAALTMKVGDARAKLIYQALCNRADPDGTNAWPGNKYLAEAAECSVQTVTRKLQYLQENGFIREGDQRFVAHLRADRRPVVYDVALSEAARRDWAEAYAPSSRQQTAAAAGSKGGRASVTAAQTRGDKSHGVTSMEPRSPRGQILEPRNSQVKRGQILEPRSPRGSKPNIDTSYRPTPPPPTPSTGPIEADETVVDRPEEAEENETKTAARALVAELPGTLTAGQRYRLADAIAARIKSGWTVEALVAELTVDLGNVRSFDAVYRHRLAALPAEPPIDTVAPQRVLPPLGGEAHEFESDPSDPDSCHRCPRPRENRVHQAAQKPRSRANTPDPATGSGYAGSEAAQARSGRRDSGPVAAGWSIGSVLASAGVNPDAV